MSTQLASEQDVGRVTVEITVENMGDLWETEKGRIPLDQVRRVTIPDALVDTGATTLALPKRLVEQLGLDEVRQRSVVSCQGIGTISVRSIVRLHILGRDCAVEVMEVSDQTPALVGQIPLEMMDLVVNPKLRQVTGNPAHGGEEVLELFSCL
jgi:clan AA aspartic protease